MENMELQLLREKIARLEARIEQVEHKLNISPQPQQPAPQSIPPTVAVQPPPVTPPKPVVTARPVMQPQSTQIDIPVAARAPKESWEQKIGGTWLYRIGVVALLIGLAFFLKFAFDKDWINDFGQVAIGYLTGGLLVAAGFWYRGRGNLPKFGSGLGGGGIGAWFITTWAAFNYYQLFAQTPAFVIMAGVTVVGMALAIWWNSPTIAGLGLLGGYLTPLLIPGSGGHMALFTYLLILNVGVLAVLVKKNWNGLAFISLGFTTLMFGFSMQAFYEVEYLLVFMGYLSAYHLLFAMQGLAVNLVHRSPVRQPVLGIVVISGGFYALFSAVLLFENHRNILTAILLAWGLFYLAQMVAIRHWRSEDTNLGSVLLSLALGYITLAIPMRFSGSWVTMVWTIQAAVLIVIGWQTRVSKVRGWGLVVLGLALWRLVTMDLALFTDVYLLVHGNYIYPWGARLPAALLAVSAMLLTAWLYSRQNASKGERNLVPWLILGANVLALLFMLGEWSRWYYHLGESISGYDWKAFRATAWTLTMAGNLALLLVLWQRWKYRPLQTLAIILLPVAIFWSAFIDIKIFWPSSSNGYISPMAGRLPAAVLVAVLAFVAAWMFAVDPDIGKGRKKLLGWISAFANFLILSSVLRELNNYYFVNRAGLAHPWQVYRNTSWSAVMSLYGFVLVAVGVWRKYSLLRRLGIGLLLVTVAKIILVDLTGLETIWRILVFIGTGATLILVSWVYQRFVVTQVEN